MRLRDCAASGIMTSRLDLPTAPRPCATPAADPDDDDVTFRMEGAPMGMTIGERNGKIQYVGSVDEPGGDYQIQIIAEDGSGGSATWEFGISVSPGSNAPEKPDPTLKRPDLALQIRNEGFNRRVRGLRRECGPRGAAPAQRHRACLQ